MTAVITTPNPNTVLNLDEALTLFSSLWDKNGLKKRVLAVRNAYRESCVCPKVSKDEYNDLEHHIKESVRLLYRAVTHELENDGLFSHITLNQLTQCLAKCGVYVDYMGDTATVMITCPLTGAVLKKETLAGVDFTAGTSHIMLECSRLAIEQSFWLK